MRGAGDKALLSPEITKTVWDNTVDFAEKANEPGKFTAFCSYEWTSMPNNMNLHRNIFFKDCKHIPPAPFSSLDSTDPSELWKWMDGQRKAGNELLAISHNADLSDGRMYPTEVDLMGRSIDKVYAGDRMRNEPLIEIAQTKGQSEAHPLLSPNDEFANYNVWAFLLGDPQGRIAHIVGSYARQALKDGIALQNVKGFNPYKFGFGAASDSHATGVPYRNDNYFGTLGTLDGSIEARMSGRVLSGNDVRQINTAGLTGVWAEENTREAIFNAMQRKETFAVSGPHIKVRFFGGWNFANGETADQRKEFWKNSPDWIKDPNWVKAAYDRGVPMGGDLPSMPGDATVPSFAVWAVKDPTSGNLDRIQIVKGWTKSGQSFEKVFHVADKVGDVVSDPMAEADGAATAPWEPSLIIREPAGSEWMSLGTIPLVDADWLRQVAATRDIPGDRPRRMWPLTAATADSLSYAGWRARIALVVPLSRRQKPARCSPRLGGARARALRHT
jgi:hypothetical protein